MKEQIVICMPSKNTEKTIKKSIFSVLHQTGIKRETILLIGNDNSTDDSEIIIKEISSQNANVILLNVNFGNVSLNRNFLNDYARKNYPNCVLIGRLDADDVIYNEHTISQIEALYDKHNFDVLICGNKQILKGNILDWENKANIKLLNDNFVLENLYNMTQGDAKAELPSCNTFIKPTVKTQYPNKVSAEDHWFTTLLLLQKEKLNILIDEKLLYCIYSLDGFVTNSNKKSNNYIQSRNELYSYYIKEIAMQNILKKWNNYIVDDGLSFHLANIQKNKSKLKKYWLLNFPVNTRIKKELTSFQNKKIRLLDICCGPFPKSGIFAEDYTIERTLVDTLSESYHSMLKENSIKTYEQKIICCNVEELHNNFSMNSFEIIYSKNALDHTYNPIEAIANLINLITHNGVIILEHYINEGKYTNYYGLHQWDFNVENGDFIISNYDKTVNFNATRKYTQVNIETSIDGNKIINIIRKNNDK